MKTFKTTQPALFIIFSLFLLNSCCLCNLCKTKVHYNEADFEQSWNESTSNVIPDQIIASYTDMNQIATEDSILNKVTILDSCACGTLYLLEPNPTIHIEGLLSSRPRQPAQNGSTFMNLNLNLNIIPRKSNKIIYDGIYIPTNPSSTTIQTKSAQRDTIKIAIIDGGIPKAEIFTNHIWVNRKEFTGQDNFDDDNNCYQDDKHGYDFTKKQGVGSDEANMHGNFIGQIISDYLGEQIPYQFMDIRIFDKDGKGNLFDALCAINYAIDNGADIINLSWGYYRDISETEGLLADSLLLHFINKAAEKNIPVFASAGNDTINTDSIKYHYPSGFFSVDGSVSVPENIISVAALNLQKDSLAAYSNYGQKSVSISTDGVHQVKNYDFWSIRRKISGTSYATPYSLSHAIKLMKLSPGIEPLEIKNCLINRSIYLDLPINSEGKINTMDMRKCE